MDNILFAIHILIAIAVVAIILLQRSEGGGLGIGGGQEKSSARIGLDGIGRTTWYIGIGLLLSSLALTIYTASNSDNGANILEQLRNNNSTITETTESSENAIIVPNLDEDSTAPTENDSGNSN